MGATRNTTDRVHTVRQGGRQCKILGCNTLSADRKVTKWGPQGHLNINPNPTLDPTPDPNLTP